jgi:hypothetical protein
MLPESNCRTRRAAATTPTRRQPGDGPDARQPEQDLTASDDLSHEETSESGMRSAGVRRGTKRAGLECMGRRGTVEAR